MTQKESKVSQVIGENGENNDTYLSFVLTSKRKHKDEKS